MADKVAFATSNWKDKPNKPDNMTQGEWDSVSSSKFSGFPFPVYFAKKWTGGFNRPLSQVAAWYNDPYSNISPMRLFGTVPGWLESNGDTPIFPSVSTPPNSPSGVTVHPKYRPIIYDGGGWLGPFTREDATRLWWTAKRINHDGPFDFSRNASVSYEREEFTPEPDSPCKACASAKSYTISDTVSNPTPDETHALNSSDTEISAKITNYETKKLKSTLKAYATHSSRGNWRTSTGVTYQHNMDPCTGGTGIDWFATVFVTLEPRAVCDIDNPEDFYIGFNLDMEDDIRPYKIYIDSGVQGCREDILDKTDIFSKKFVGSHPDLTPPVPDPWFENNYYYFFYYLFERECSGPFLITHPGYNSSTGPFYDIVSINANPSINGTFNYFEGKSKTFKVYYENLSSNRVGNDSDYFSTSAGGPGFQSLNLKVSEYFTYDDGSGNPIYDTQTGAILRDPVTGAPV